MQAFSFQIVGVRRLELPTPCTPCKYASQLRHTPISFEGAKIIVFLIFAKLYWRNLFLSYNSYIKICTINGVELFLCIIVLNRLININISI